MNVSDLVSLLDIKSLALGGPRFITPLDADELMISASRLSGKSDYYPQCWEDGFRSYIDIFDNNPHLGIIDRLMVRAEILRQLSRRLALVDLLKKQPAIAQERIENPIFITGSPRTGTTILFELLSQDPALRSPLDFEVRSPMVDDREYFQLISMEHEALQHLNPEMKSLHEARPDLPAECALIMGVSLAYALKNDEGPITWVNRKNLRDAYRFHKLTLQSLQHKSNKRKWLLKCPFHIFSIPTLLESYPDSKIIYTHRDHTKAMSSLLKIYKSLFFNQEIFCDINSSRKEILIWSQAHQAVTDLRKSNEGINDRIYDIQFTDLMESPLAAIERMYDHLEIQLSDEARSRMESYLKNRPRFKYGKYECRPGDFGLSRAEISEVFHSYHQCYGVTAEPDD